ncbi:Na/Pi cotransporter family protein [Sphingobacteriales bacterium UPWRP_1]|nr:hypothetical protein BVG80_05695 [Sphingobacteriales bacterium TSM_CSM]PSJ77993.1 Na/Pi cotransporter family protein [Sphingobacteriales bacterium UPWRP_1]
MITGILTILQIIGALSIFIYGMKIMSESLQKAAGNRLRQVLGKMTANRANGFFTGLLLTMLIQSSSATTVMLVSFVNAGLVSFMQSMAVTIGANVGTTITAWIVWLFGFEVAIESAALIAIGLAFPMLFFPGKKRDTAEFVIGFGLLFIGLNFLRTAVPDIDKSEQVFLLLQYFSENNYVSYLFFVALGAIFTAIIQSSSASTAVTMVMLSNGWIEFPQAAAMVLGENIGTTITANLAALLGNIHAKRAARYHTFFNVTGVAWALLLFPFFLQFIDWLQSLLFTGHTSILTPYNIAGANATMLQQRQSIETNGIAMFHTMFNVLNAFIHLGLIPYSAAIIVRLFPASKKNDEVFKLQHMDKGLVAFSELSISEAQNEIRKLADLVEKMSGNVVLLLFGEVKNRQNLLTKIEQREELTDVLEKEVSIFLSRLISAQIAPKSSEQVRAMLAVVNDLESIADHLRKIATRAQKFASATKPPTQEVLTELQKILSLDHKAIVAMKKQLVFENKIPDNTETQQLETEINRLYLHLVDLQHQRIEKGLYKLEEGLIYLDILRSAEKIGDHISSIMRTLSGVRTA